MDYIYAALLLHNAKKDITEENVTAVLKAAGIEADTAKLKGLIATLKNVDIEEAIKKAAMPVGGAAPVVEDKPKEEEKEEEPEVSEDQAAEGLGALFG